MMRLFAGLAFLFISSAASSFAQENTAPVEVPALPEGDTGIASQYANDVDIGKDPKVVFTDDYESGKTNFDNNWGGVTFTQDAENVHSAKRAMELKLVRPSEKKEAGLGVNHHFKDGYDTLFMRYYAKFSKDTELFHGGTHAGGSIMARGPGVPDAKPGIPADGKNEYTVLLDTWRPDDKVASPGNLVCYVYHPEQRHQWGEQFFPTGHLLPYTEKKPDAFFGKEFKARPDIVPPRDKWVCYELMVKANTPGKRDGRIAFWVDGKLAADFPNLRLRDIDSLKANRLGLGLYTQNDDVKKTCVMWFDDVVVATSYIGPQVKEKKPLPAQTPNAAPGGTAPKK